ncbi:MAG: CDP-alcohol phosphatidyltransferase family protein [Polyangiaceae bacterium]
MTPGDVRATFDADRARDERLGEWPAHVLYRPLSFGIAASCVRLGIRPNTVTAVGFACAVASPVAAYVLRGVVAWVVVAALGVAFGVLDCVDGNVARARGDVTRTGAFLDGVSDATFDVAFPVAMALLVVQASVDSSATPLVFGVTTALASLATRRVRDEFERRFATDAHVDKTADGLSPFGFVVVAFGSLDHLFPFAVVLGGATHMLGAALVGSCAYAVVVFVVALASAVAKARALDALTAGRRHRNG